MHVGDRSRFKSQDRPALSRCQLREMIIEFHGETLSFPSILEATLIACQIPVEFF